MSNQLDESVKHRAIELLARESGVPFDQVAQLYEHEQARHQLEARVKKFVPIFTFRSVQEKLRQHRSALAPPAQLPNHREPRPTSVHCGSVHPGSVQRPPALESGPLRNLEQPVDEERVEPVCLFGIDEMR